MNSTLSNMTQLVGTLNIDVHDLDKLRQQTEEMKELGYYGAYFNNIFFTMETLDYKCSEDDILFREDKCLIIRRPIEQLMQVRSIVEDAGLVIQSSHFLNMLPEPGSPVESIFSTHDKILDMAQIIGMQRVTTHIGGIAVPTAAKSKNSPTPAEMLENEEITYYQYADMVKEIYGADKIISDSLIAYRHLCAEAAIRNITPTIETACSELLEINTRPEAIIQFIKDVGADNLGICIDSGHCHLNHLNIPEIIEKCGDYFIETHFHDNFGINDNHNPIGIGTINWFNVIRIMNETGYNGTITFEQGDYVTNYRNWMLFIERWEKNAT